MSYGSNAEILEIVLKDTSGRKIDSFRCNNDKEFTKIIKLIKDKYGYGKKIYIEEEEIDPDWFP